MHHSKILAVVFAACLALVSKAQVIPNHSFEANSFQNGAGYASENGGSITGWVLSNPGRIGLNLGGTNTPGLFADNGAIPNGTNVAFIQAINGTNSISTTISGLVPGMSYQVSFRANQRALYSPPIASWSLNGGALVPFTASPEVGGLNPYYTNSATFTATNTTAALVVQNAIISGDGALLVDDFTIQSLPTENWTAYAWTNDASTGITPTKTLWAYHFGATDDAVINGVTVPGTGTDGNPSVPGQFTVTGIPSVFLAHDNNLTALGGNGSAVMARSFIYNGSPGVLTVEGLTPGRLYTVSIFGVGFDTAPQTRTSIFTNGIDHLVVDEDSLGIGNGLRLDYTFAASATTNVTILTPVDGFTFHTYGLALRQEALTTVVINLNDSGPGSLRQAVLDSVAAGGTSNILFSPALSGQTITLSNQIQITNTVTIDASSLSGGIQLSGAGSNRLFRILTGGFVTLKSLTLANGYAPDLGQGGAIHCVGRADLFNCNVISNRATRTTGYVGGGIYNFRGFVNLTGCNFVGNTAGNTGGAIYNLTTALLATNVNGLGAVTISNCTFAYNSAPFSGAIENDGILLASQSTFYENSAGDSGAIYNGTNRFSTASLSFCTVVSNHATSPQSGLGGGGIENFGNLTLVGCIVAGNTSVTKGPDIWMTGQSLLVTNCLIGDGGTTALINGANGNFVGSITAPLNPWLGPLANNGGSTLTMLPLPGSPAIDAGGTTTLTNDQRGLPRVYGPAVDIGPVEARVNTVVNTADSGPGSLRYAVSNNSAGLPIAFAPALSGQTIHLTSGEIGLSSNAVIDASSLAGGLALDGSHNSRIFHVHASAAVKLDSLTLSNGYANGNFPDYYGGGIFNDTGATLTLTNCTVLSNNATWSGGIENEGTLNVYCSTFLGNTTAAGGGAIGNASSQASLAAENSTFYRNSGSLYGGAIFNQAASATFIHCTIFGNSSPNGEGGGVDNIQGGSIFVASTIIAGNTAFTGNDVNSDNNSIFGGPNNVIGGNPLLAPLGNYGGRTLTMPPLPGSPALDNGFPVSNQTDQRGFPRPIGGFDIGAVEGIYNPAGPSPLTGAAKLNTGAIQFGFTNYSGMPHTVLVSTNFTAPMNTWLKIGTAVESPVGSGQYQFTDLDAANNKTRFYRVKTP